MGYYKKKIIDIKENSIFQDFSKNFSEEKNEIVIFAVLNKGRKDLIMGDVEITFEENVYKIRDVKMKHFSSLYEAFKTSNNIARIIELHESLEDFDVDIYKAGMLGFCNSNKNISEIIENINTLKEDGENVVGILNLNKIFNDNITISKAKDVYSSIVTLLNKNENKQTNEKR